MGEGLGLGQQQGSNSTSNGNGDGSNGDQTFGGHNGHDTGTGDHKGSTGVLGGDTLRSRAHGKINKSNAMPGSVQTTAQGHAGGTAKVRGTGDLRIVGPSEIDGVERSDVPQEYRDQVRQYFQP